jgi:hypothetical protein
MKICAVSSKIPVLELAGVVEGGRGGQGARRLGDACKYKRCPEMELLEVGDASMGFVKSLAMES